jgi:hypothetical protein
VGRVLLAGLLSAAVLPVVALAGGSPGKLSREGRISALHGLRITIHGRTHDLTCRIHALSPQKLGYAVGNRVKITCDGGLLTGISGKNGTVTVEVSPGNHASASTSSSSTTSSSSSASASSSASSSQASSASASAQGSNGASEFDFVGPIASISGTSIAFGSTTCQIGSGSPDASKFHAGDRVHAHCTNGVLTSIVAAS